ncbi:MULTISPECIES: class I SAM-dependent methyltransferase [Rhodopseudomonas]|uniref:SAM-dependent methyltransferase n=1 Tax=Rhodopseudomonas palustris TaxID=1076 RepID=A0A0D7F523_RHOPL|nr:MULTISPECIES: class I SAM-dependent methyltransferase [Rhodopseudomonas]KIZ47900.1 SAM-dependent methyltransferase [Rhodopseudomonas palustris]MDF3813610.1 class I SAM-dependent methyltransferase [Rhodopseudomonas sp. BAL398]WOK17012.1 class I SAM-dependent methyltransferase [Rhodopseudomonas sp. BAL398]
MTSEEFNRWEARFSSPDFVFGTEPNAFLASCRELLPSQGRALAIADGEGRNGVFLAQCGLSVTSVDFSPAAQRKAQRLAEAKGGSIAAQTADILAWDWPTGFDVVAGIFFQFAAPEDRRKIFSGIRQALNPGGLLLIQGYRPKQLIYKTGGPSRAENLYTRQMLEEVFADFDNLSIKEHDSVIHEGAGHGGMSALIDLIGWKRP